jgi:hypothetical protein
VHKPHRISHGGGCAALLIRRVALPSGLRHEDIFEPEKQRDFFGSWYMYHAVFYA